MLVYALNQCPVGEKRLGVYWKCRFSIFIQLVFHLFICGRGLQSRPCSVRSDRHTRRGRTSVCLMGWEPAEWWFPWRAGPTRAEATLTAAEPQVGQRGTTELVKAQLPPNPLGSAVNPPNVWLRCVRHKTKPFNTSAPAPTSDSLPPAALPLTTSLSPGRLYIHPEHYFPIIQWTLQLHRLFAKKSKFNLSWQASSCSCKSNLSK